jgi:hypothetical protein
MKLPNEGSFFSIFKISKIDSFPTHLYTSHLLVDIIESNKKWTRKEEKYAKRVSV